MRRWTVTLFALLLVATAGFAATGRDLRLAARSGDLAEVKRLIADGIDVDSADDWGTTALYLASNQAEIEVVRFLLEKGADPSAAETFFGSSALGVALWKGGPEYTVAKALLAAGAKGRAEALAHALENEDASLARAAVDAGPVTESEAAELDARFGQLEGEFAEILAELKTEKDPPPPTYTKEQLGEFAGKYEGGSAQVEITVVEGGLTLESGGTKTRLSPVEVRVFRDAESGLTLAYYGRAGTIEGIVIELPGQERSRLRPAEAPVASVGDLPEFVEDPDREPTVNWPGFRGANRDGNGDGADTPVEFDVDSGEGVAWSVDRPGLANSSPVIWGDRIYVTTAVAAGGSVPLKVGLTGAGDEVDENSEHRWLVMAYDKWTGKQAWETEVGHAVPLTKRHFKATQANSSPVTDGEHLVVVFPTAGLACLGMDGSLHWKHELGGLNAGGFNDPGMQWGFAASPIIYKDKVILQVDIHEGAYIAAWDLKSGKPLWKTDRPDVAPSWSTPAIWPTPDGDELVVNASVIRGYDPNTGRPLWSLGPTSIQVVAAPVVGESNLFVSSGYPPARPIYAVKPGIRGDHVIESEDDAGPLAWYTTRGGAYMPTPLLYRGLLYMVHHNARLVAHDPRNGARVYQARFSAGGTMTASPVAANGRIYQGSEEGTLYVLEAGGEYRELAIHEFGEPLMATPAISEGVLYVRTPSKLYALGTVRAATDSKGSGAP